MSEDVLDTPGAANDGVEGANEQPFRGNSQGMEQVGVNPERIGLAFVVFICHNGSWQRCETQAETQYNYQVSSCIHYLPLLCIDVE